MRWERLHVTARLRENSEGKKSPGRKGGIFGPGTRWGHTCTTIRGGKFLYVFGGYGKDNCQTNDVHVFDTTRQAWSKPMMKGNPPSPRDSHSCTAVGNNLFVFGGTDGKDPLQDLHILDTTSNTWISPNLCGEGPEAREGHSAALIGRRLFVFGGCGKAPNNVDEVYYNDLFILDTETLIWRHPVTSGTPPSARDSHTCSAWKNKIIVVAGEDASDYYLSDVHILDTDTLIWRVLDTSGQMLPPRAGHSTVALGRSLFVFGGFTDERNLYDDLHMLNLGTGIWTKVAPVGQGPSARFSVAGDCLDAQNGVLVFIGGCNKELEALDDMYYLHTEISMENGQEEHKPEKLSLRKELKRKCQEQVHVALSLPANNKDVYNHGTVPDMSRSMLLPSHGQAEDSGLYRTRPSRENEFEAKVTQTFHYGYTIETNISGQTLRGILFSYKPGFAHTANTQLSSKTTSDEVKVNNEKPQSEVATVNQPQVVNHRHTDGEKQSTSQDSHPMETTPASNSNTQTHVGVSQAPAHEMDKAHVMSSRVKTPKSMQPQRPSNNQQTGIEDGEHNPPVEVNFLDPVNLELIKMPVDSKDNNSDQVMVDTSKATVASVPEQGTPCADQKDNNSDQIMVDASKETVASVPKPDSEEPAPTRKEISSAEQGFSIKTT